jgi:hypothetical protein
MVQEDRLAKRRKLHNEVANTIEIPNTTTEFVIVVHNFHRANWPIKPSDVKLFTLEKVRSYN